MERSAQKNKKYIYLVGSFEILGPGGVTAVHKGLWSGCGAVVLSQTEVVRRSALDVSCMP